MTLGAIVSAFILYSKLKDVRNTCPRDDKYLFPQLHTIAWVFLFHGRSAHGASGEGFRLRCVCVCVFCHPISSGRHTRSVYI